MPQATVINPPPIPVHVQNGATAPIKSDATVPVKSDTKIDVQEIKDLDTDLKTNGTPKPLNNVKSTGNSQPGMDIHITEGGGVQSQGNAKVETYTAKKHQFPRISRPVELLRPEYDCVVIGSGYGGGVAASRMARGGQSVCLLERGKERWPGEFPSTPAEVFPQFHITGDFSPREAGKMALNDYNPTGLYHMILGQGQNAFVANGLGGTSLLNANVFLRMDPKTNALKAWPKELRDPAALKPYYDRAAYMLQPEPYPEGFPKLAKLELLKKQRDALGFGNFYRVPQTTRFENGPNNVGVEMQASSLTGQDTTGLNDGSKQTTLVTYLSDAWNWGAEIFCECEVRYITKCDDHRGGYNIFFAWHGARRGKFKEYVYGDLLWVHAKELVFLGAGTIGTSEILLRSKEHGLSMSSDVGTNMSGNGDILAFGYNTNSYTGSVGKEKPEPDAPIGPTITGVIDCRDQENALDGFVIEEGAIPQAFSGFYQTLLESLPGSISPENLSHAQSIQRVLASLGSKILGPYYKKGAAEHTQVYLIMSHDSNQAILTLENDRPSLKFLGVGRSDHVKYLNQVLADATKAVGGTFVNSPFFSLMNSAEITVHPIGGASISSDGTAKRGSTTHFGELLTGKGSEYHDGLIVVDGGLIPTALGVNPFATITALAERAVEGVAKKKGIKIDYNTKNGVLDLFGSPAHPHEFTNDSTAEAIKIIEHSTADNATGVEFTEVMSGFIHRCHDERDYVLADKAGKSACENARFFLSAHAWDIDSLVANGKHKAMLTGSFTHGSLPASPYMVLQGEFQLFNEDPRTPDTRNLTYDFDMIGTDGSVLHFHGYKLVTAAVTGSVYQTWKATSTLYVTISQPNGRIEGRGILRINPSDFGAELMTFKSYGPTLLHRLYTTSRFLNFFTRQVMNVFLGPFGALQWPETTYYGYQNKGSPTHTWKDVTAEDGIESTVNYWEPTGRQKKTTSILFVPGASVDHQIFALPTIKKNSVEYFGEHGYPVYCVTHRVGKTVKAQAGWTTYDSRLDIKAALQRIRKLQGSDEKVYIICHCAGAVATASGLLDGTIPASWVKGITASNVFFNPIFAPVNRLKSLLPIPVASVYRAVAGSWFSCSSSRNDTLVQRLLNQALRFYPVGSRSDICNSVVCHRSEMVFGRLWSHKNLNEATHAQLARFLGGTSMDSLAHLTLMGQKQEVTNNPPWGSSLVTALNLERLRGIPIYLLSGSDNTVYSPESTSKSYSVLQDTFGPDLYRRKVFSGKGHLDCWMSESGINDVWPSVLNHIEDVESGLFIEQ